MDPSSNSSLQSSYFESRKHDTKVQTEETENSHQVGRPGERLCRTRQGRAGWTYTIMQSIMKTFHRAMKTRKCLRLRRNSRMLSPGKSESVFTSTVNISAATAALCCCGFCPPRVHCSPCSSDTAAFPQPQHSGWSCHYHLESTKPPS